MLCFNHHGKANNARVECAIGDKKKYKPFYNKKYHDLQLFGRRAINMADPALNVIKDQIEKKIARVTPRSIDVAWFNSIHGIRHKMALETITV